MLWLEVESMMSSPLRVVLNSDASTEGCAVLRGMFDGELVEA